MKSKIKLRPEVLVDMDNVLCDYRSLYIEKIEQFPDNKYPQSQYGYFLELKPMPLAVECFNWMTTWADVSILTAPSYYNPSCLAEKNYWVRKYFGIEYAKKTIMAHDKSKVFGHYLIDDGIENGQLEWAIKHKGKLIQFGSKKTPDWTHTYKFLKAETSSQGIKTPSIFGNI